MNPKENNVRAIIDQVSQLSKTFSQLEATPRTFGCDVLLHCVEIHLIEAIGTIGPTNITELAKHLGVTKGAISQKIARLYKLGLVDKTPLFEDKRNVNINLTHMGQKAFDGHAAFHNEVFETFMGGSGSLTNEDLVRLKDQLALLTTIFTKV